MCPEMKRLRTGQGKSDRGGMPGGPAPVVFGGAAIALIVMAKRPEANRLPLPAGPAARRVVRWRRLRWDRDVPRDQPWEERGRFDSGAGPEAGRRSDA